MLKTHRGEYINPRYVVCLREEDFHVDGKHIKTRIVTVNNDTFYTTMDAQSVAEYIEKDK